MEKDIDFPCESPLGLVFRDGLSASLSAAVWAGDRWAREI